MKKINFTIIVLLVFAAFVTGSLIIIFNQSEAGKVRGANIIVSPQSSRGSVGGSMTLDVTADILESSTQAYEVNLNFNPSILQVVDVTTPECNIPFNPSSYDNSTGLVSIARGCTELKTGKFNMAKITFNIIGPGRTIVTPVNTSKIISSSDFQPITLNFYGAKVSIGSLR